jgi:DNA-directed RNA polymerase subunit RPC12/RpoP
MKTRKNFKQWVHYNSDCSWPYPRQNETGHTTVCGKTARRIRVTSDKNLISCPRCLEIMKQNEWWCPNCGFLEAADVTFTEHCEICGEKL